MLSRTHTMRWERWDIFIEKCYPWRKCYVIDFDYINVLVCFSKEMPPQVKVGFPLGKSSFAVLLCGHFQLHKQLWWLAMFKNCLIWLEIMNFKDWTKIVTLTFKIWNWDANVIRAQNEWSHISHRSSELCWPGWCLIMCT